MQDFWTINSIISHFWSSSWNLDHQEKVSFPQIPLPGVKPPLSSKTLWPGKHTVDGSNPHSQPPGMVRANLVNHGVNYLFLNWWVDPGFQGPINSSVPFLLGHRKRLAVFSGPSSWWEAQITSRCSTLEQTLGAQLGQTHLELRQANEVRYG